MCGNHIAAALMSSRGTGSPPRVREPPDTQAAHALLLRITPACAGTTILRLGNFLPAQDHPRVCGNHSEARSESGSLLGSPPRVREPHG